MICFMIGQSLPRRLLFVVILVEKLFPRSPSVVTHAPTDIVACVALPVSGALVARNFDLLELLRKCPRGRGPVHHPARGLPSFYARHAALVCAFDPVPERIALGVDEF